MEARHVPTKGRTGGTKNDEAGRAERILDDMEAGKQEGREVGHILKAGWIRWVRRDRRVCGESEGYGKTTGKESGEGRDGKPPTPPAVLKVEGRGSRKRTQRCGGKGGKAGSGGWEEKGWGISGGRRKGGGARGGIDGHTSQHPQSSNQCRRGGEREAEGEGRGGCWGKAGSQETGEGEKPGDDPNQRDGGKGRGKGEMVEGVEGEREVQAAGGTKNQGPKGRKRGGGRRKAKGQGREGVARQGVWVTAKGKVGRQKVARGYKAGCICCLRGSAWAPAERTIGREVNKENRQRKWGTSKEELIEREKVK
ncbi:unnamed protein product [Prunus armeniaca]|uniref:Uncharacterized protein n=1 Tax=Prunus armeniaca TaxID=36596 RepID=A0A6J5WQ39_PRUAR|nr:unnamed protein product [Prunus armeniaca]